MTGGASETGATGPIDPAALDNLREIGGGDPAFIRDLVVMFREDSPPRFADIASALAQGDTAGVARHAHSLKGSGANFGAVRFRGLAQQIETAGKAGDLSGVPAMLDALRSEFDLVSRALDAVVAAP